MAAKADISSAIHALSCGQKDSSCRLEVMEEKPICSQPGKASIDQQIELKLDPRSMEAFAIVVDTLQQIWQLKSTNLIHRLIANTATLHANFQSLNYQQPLSTHCTGHQQEIVREKLQHTDHAVGPQTVNQG
jgi:hypothetical protein